MTTKGETNRTNILQSWVFAFFCGFLILTASSSNVLAQSTDRDNPTPLAANEVKGYAPGKKVEYYFTFLAGPGDVVVTIDSGAKGSFSEFRAELFDMDAERLTSVQVLPYPGETSRRVGRTTLGTQQPVLLRLTLDKESAQYMARIGGAAQFAGTDASFSSEPSPASAAPVASADATGAAPPATTETSQPPATDAVTIAATPVTGKVSGVKKFWLKLSTAGEIMGLAGLGSLHLEMKDGTAQDISLGKIKKVLVGEATSAPTDGSNLTPSGEDKSSGWQRFWLKLGSAGDFTGLSGRPLRLEMKDGTVQEFSPAKLKKVSLKK